MDDAARRVAAAMMPFVGRQAEIRRIWRVLESGGHVVLSARYGMGRTSLMRRIAELHGHEMPFAFADLSAGSGEASRRIYGALGGRPGARPGDLSYRTVRHRLLHELGEEGRPCALVLEARVQGVGGYPMGIVTAVENERRRHGRRCVCRVVMVD